jgi:hypothetical protein
LAKKAGRRICRRSTSPSGSILPEESTTPVERVARALFGGSQRCICASMRAKQAASALHARQRSFSRASVNSSTW